MTRQEKTVIYFLIFMLVLGLCIKFYKLRTRQINLKIESAACPINEIDLEKVISEKQKVNINVAGLKDFQRLPGIGPHLAKMIVEHRDKNGSFVAPDEIREVKGIGPKKYNKIKDYLTVE